MQVLKSEKFGSHSKLTEFINENTIRREDVLSIVADGDFMYTLFYYVSK